MMDLIQTVNPWLALAAVTATFTALVHCFAGGRFIVPPLLEAGDIHPIPKFTHYYCWHLVSLILFAIGIGFAYGAVRPDGLDLAVAATVVSGAYFVWNVALIVWKSLSPKRMPQWALFLPTTVLGIAGLL